LIIFIKSKAENQLKFKKRNSPRHQHMCITIKLLRCDTPSSYHQTLWLLNISDFSPVDYRMLAMLHEWVCQHPVWHVDKLRQPMSDIQTAGHWSSDWSVVIQAEGMSYGQTWTFSTSDIVPWFTITLHCWSIRFHTLCDVSFKCWETVMMMFKLTWRNRHWLWHVNTWCVSQDTIKRLFKRDCRFWHRVTNLLEYMCATNYQNRAWFDKVIAKTKWCSFLTHSVHTFYPIGYTIGH